MTIHDIDIRPARPADKAAVVAMVATVWGGHDYIPEVWDAWLHDASGPLLVGVLDERPVAIAKLTALSAGEDWFEGLRVDPALRGRGLARAMLRRCIELSDARGAHALRYMTNEDNPTMHRVGEELGFVLRYRASELGVPARAGAALTQPLTFASIACLLDDLEHSALLRLTGGLYSLRWSAYTLSEARLRAHLERGEILALPGATAWAIVVPDDEFGYWLAHAEGNESDLTHLFAALRTLSMPHKQAGLRTQIHPAAPCIAALLAAGFASVSTGVRVYELLFQGRR